jgi:hypothetical protein
MGQRGPKKKTAEPPPPLTPQGVAGKKRTPTSSFDPAAGKDIYEPEKIVATRGAQGVTQFHVKWVGYDAKHNTWEPIKNLASCEGMIAEFMHGDLQKSDKDSTLEHSLFAAFNTN